MPETIISVKDLSKCYLIGHQNTNERYATLRETLVRQGKNIVRKSIDLARGRQLVYGHSIEEFWALDEVNFEINKGDVMGIIGRNGAGKSTLLKVISRITEPTKGRVTLHGRVASLLEVGTGFHPELTGRENIFLNGTILGMTRREIQSKFDEIVDFAGVEKFLDTPVKRYSSGMHVRLAFAVAAHLEPEILVVDEVLAVGDAEFQRKCLAKIKDVASGGRTVLFVSHNMSAIRNLCSRGLVLEKGQVSYFGGTARALDHYTLNSDSENAVWHRGPSPPKAPVTFDRIEISTVGKQPSIDLKCSITASTHKKAASCFVAVDIWDNTLSPLMQALPSTTPFTSAEPGEHKIEVLISLPPLIPGHYFASFWIGPHFDNTFDQQKQILSFEVLDSPSQGRTVPHTSDHGFIVPESSYRCEFNATSNSPA